MLSRKMIRKVGFVFLLVFAISFLSKAQKKRNEINLELFVENLFQVQDLDIAYEDLYESLFLLYTNPINLNRTNAEELASLFILSPIQITSFINYVNKNGDLLSIYELQAIPNFDMNTIRNLLPFVVVAETGLAADTRPLFQRIITEENNYFFTRYQRILETQKGYTPPTFNSAGEPSSRYVGSPDKYLSRFRVSHRNDFSLGFSFEKDAGEGFNWDPASKSYGFDYLSGHFYLQNRGRLKTLALGDYQVQIGQGLIFGAGFAPGKGAESVTTVRRSNTGIRAYNSVLESGFFRGAAATYDLGTVQVSGYLSRLPQDGGISADTLFSDFEEYISSIQITGFHRTPTELENRRAILEHTAGATLSHSSVDRKLQLSASVLQTQYSAGIKRRPSNYNQFEFNGKSNTVYGIAGSYIWQNINLFGEVAQSSSGGIGAVGGIMASLSALVDFSLVLRNYDRDFHSFYGNAFSENSRIINERGVYWGIKVKPSRKVYFSAYYDKFSFPWLRFRAEAPSEGYEYLIRFNYQPSRSVLLYAQMREEGKELNVLGSDPNLNVLALGKKYNYLLNLDYNLSKIVSLKSRVQYSTYELNGVHTEGIAVMQDLNFDIGKFRLSSRFALFDTDDFQNRQYVYERDVLYGFSIPAYSGLGTRNYLLAQYKINRKTTFWVRFARFSYRNQDTVGSGLDEIQGNIRSELKFQVLRKF
jgi:hypothetical protein